MNQKGAWELFLLTLLNVMQVLCMIFVFYEIPKRWFGQFRLNTNEVSNIDILASVDLRDSERHMDS